MIVKFFDQFVGVVIIGNSQNYLYSVSSIFEFTAPKIKKIATLNFKGGTGKTTTAVNLSDALALKRQSVLVIDCDPQGSVADWLDVNPRNTFFSSNP